MYTNDDSNKVLFVGFIDNCISYSVDRKIDNLTGHELVGNESLEELELSFGFWDSSVKFVSLGKVKKLIASAYFLDKENISVDF